MPQAIINLMYLCTQKNFHPLFPWRRLKFCQKILRFDSRVDLADFPPILSCSVADYSSIKVADLLANDRDWQGEALHIMSSNDSVFLIAASGV
jgi:hypothetical protein